MQNEMLLDLWWRQDPRAINIMKDHIEKNKDVIKSMMDDIMEIKKLVKEEDSQQLANILNSFKIKWKAQVEEFILLDDIDEKERHSIESNAMIQSTLCAFSLASCYPYVSCKDYIQNLAKQLEMSLKTESVSLLTRQLIYRKIWLSNLDTQKRIRASQKSGWHIMTGSKIFKDEPMHLSIYEISYFEIINILDRFDSSKQRNEECRLFREKLKKWGKERIVCAIKKEMPSILYRYRVFQRKRGLDFGEDTFFNDMQKVHQRYHSFITSGKVRSKVWNRNDGLNEKFGFYLCMIYAYVKKYTDSYYRKVALFFLDEIYGANTIGCIKSHCKGLAISREYTLDTDNPYKNKRMFHIHKLCTSLSLLIIATMANYLKEKDPAVTVQNDFFDGLLINLNCLLKVKGAESWGMIFDDQIQMDFDLWFMYRPFILPMFRWNSSENTFCKIDKTQKWLNFFYDWRNGNERKNLDHIIKLLDEMDIGKSKPLMDGILYQMYRSDNIDKALKNIDQNYILPIYDEYFNALESNEKFNVKQAVYNLNNKARLKVPIHDRLIHNIYYEVYDNLYLFEKQEILKKHQISIKGGSLMENEDIQCRIQYILKNYGGDRRQIKDFKCYIERATWLPEDQVKWLRDIL